MDVRLVVERGTDQKRVVHLHSEQTIVGRRHDCDVRILSSQVSRRHCLLSIQNGYLNVEDLDSSNGTFINGQRAVGKQILHPGDSLEVGPLRFIVEYELTQDAVDRLERKGNAAASEEELEVLPVVEEAHPDVEELPELVPLTDKDTDLADVPTPSSQADEPVPLAEEIDENSWHLPQSNDLRDLLSKMDDEKPRPRRSKRNGS
jgi:pSer/pThr/pTyr-binding forkhead associated (FHA) protein